MAAKRATTKTAAKASTTTKTTAKANTKAKITKPALPPTKAATKRKRADAAALLPSVSAKAPAKRKRADTTTTATPAPVPAKTSTKRKRTDDDAPPPPAKKAKATTTKSKAATAKEEKVPTTTKTTKEKRAKASPAPAPVKKAKTLTKGAIINEPPTVRLHVFVFGEGTAGELGLGTPKNAIDVKRPRLNPHLNADKVGVVQVVAGGMHVVALTHDNKILTWGVNDQGALGRDTQWEGGLKDMDAAQDDDDSDDEDDDNGLNPRESTPGEVDFSTTEVAEGTRWVQVAAGDSCTFALTDDGRVYGWGTFRGNEGVFGFNAQVETAMRPLLLPDLKKITAIAAGANHALALDSNGAVFAWGSGQQNQLGRRVVERTKLQGLTPRQFGLPKGAKKGIVAIETGAYHSFAISKNGDVYSWGLNNFGETGIPDNAGQDDAVILKPQVVTALQGKTIVSIKGGAHHSIAATDDGDCLIWGRIDGNQIGISQDEIADMSDNIVMKDDKNEPRIMKVPQKVTAIEGEVVHVATNSDHNIVVTKDGKAWSWGFSANYQTGQGQVDDVMEATMIDNTAVRERKLNGATTGGQFGIVTAAQ